MSDAEQQEEELEVLKSIYEGDENFKEISATCFQYKYGEEEDKSFIVEISWPPTYPSTLPIVNLEVFYNKMLPDTFKQTLKEKILEQVEMIGEGAMTFSVFEWLREEAEQLISTLPELILQSAKVI